eukprot:767176-Hanusia_phi.AAC.6
MLRHATHSQCHGRRDMEGDARVYPTLPWTRSTPRKTTATAMMWEHSTTKFYSRTKRKQDAK